MFNAHVRKELSAYHHGEIATDERIRIETHLRICSECRSVYEEIQLGARLASCLQVSRAPDSVWENVGKFSARQSRRRWRISVAFAGLLTAIVLLVLLRNYLSPGPAWDVTG